MAPKSENWEKAVEYWTSLPSIPSATYGRERVIDANNIAPQVTWGTS